MNEFVNKVFYKSSQNMREIPDNTIDLVVTSPPYFNIKDYSKNGYQTDKHSTQNFGDLGSIDSYDIYINELLKVWKECERVLKPNGKLIINTPLMPMKKADYNSHYNRHIFNIDADIQSSILKNIHNVFLFDVYIWNRTNPTKSLMFGSYPYPRNFYAQNTSEFITVYVKDGAPLNSLPKEIKEKSRLTESEWVEYTQQIWNIPIPNKNDIAFGKHSALMPEEIVRRCVRLFSFKNDIILDPFTGSGTTLKVAKELKRNYVGYEIYKNYKTIIDIKTNPKNEIFEESDFDKNIKIEKSDKIYYFLDEDFNGYLDYEIENNRLLIKHIFVSQKRNKIATNLLNKLIEFAEQNDIEYIDFYTLLSKEVLSFLIKFDFEPEFDNDKYLINNILSSQLPCDYVFNDLVEGDAILVHRKVKITVENIF